MVEKPSVDLFGRPLPGGQAAPARQLVLGLKPGPALGIQGGGLLRLSLWSAGAGNPIGQATGALSAGGGAGEREIGQRWAAALRRRYPGGFAAKRIARAFDVDARTAESWLAGQAPFAKYLLRAWRLHGGAMVAEVLAPDDGEAKAALNEAALIGIEHQLGKLGDELARLKLERVKIERPTTEKGGL